MVRRCFAALAVFATVVLLLAVAPAQASEPSSGTISAATPELRWSGGPLPYTTFSVGCEPVGPTCDVFDLTVGALDAAANDVLISVAAGNAGDVVVLYVYNAAGELVAEDTSQHANPRVYLRDPAPGAYSVRVDAMLGAPPSTGVSYQAIATALDAGPEPDPEIPCTGEDQGLAPPPAEVLEAALNDDGRTVQLDVLVLLDGVSESFAQSFFQTVALPYRELAIEVVPTFRTLPAGAITSNSTTEIIEQGKDLMPGRQVPAEFDVVEILTHRDIELLGQTAVAGMAECIGGAAFKQHSFNVSEAQEGTDQEGIVIGPLRLVPDIAAKITAHEIGHLFGGQHHFANCVEGAQTDAVTGGDSSPCSLMFNSGDFISLHFGTVNGRIVRGYALLYAASNDRSAAPAPAAAPAAAGPGGGDGARTGGELPATGGPVAGVGALALLTLAGFARRLARRA